MSEALTIRRLQPLLGREMADADSVERYRPRVMGVLGEDEHPSEILATRSKAADRLGELYEEMPKKDPDLGGIIRKRSDAVMKLPRRIAPADPSPLAQEVADFCHQALKIIPSFDINLKHQLHSRSRGVAFEEIIWDKVTRGPIAGAVVPVDLIDRPMWRFAFKKGELYVRRRAGLDPVKAPPGKFLVMRHETKDSPWGAALLDEVYWYWFIKNNAWKFYTVFVEKFASPTAIGKYPHKGGETPEATKTNEQNQATLLAAIDAIQNEYGVVIPDGVKIELLEASRSGNASYEQILTLCTRGMAMTFLGEINTSGLRPGTGAFASDKVSDDIRVEKVVLDAHDVSAHLKDNLLSLITQVNFGPDAPVPQFLIETEEAEDRKLRQEGMERVLAAGQEVTARQYYLVHQVERPRPGEEVIVRKAIAAPASAPPPQLAAGRVSLLSLPAAHGMEPAAAPTLQAEFDLSDEIAQSEERDDAFSEVAEAFKPHSLEYYQKHQELVLEAWDAGQHAQGNLLRWVADRLDPVAHAEKIETAQVHAFGLALMHLMDDGLGEGAWKTGAQARTRADESAALLDLPMRARRGRFSLAGANGIKMQTPPGFGDHTTPSTAADFWSEVLGVSKNVFNEMADSSRRFAFTVAGVEDAALLADIQELTQRASLEGWKRTRFRQELAELYERHGVTPTSDWHADLIYENNTRQANSALRYEQLVNNPAAHRLMPYLGWATLGDDRVRARPLHNHRVMHEQVFAIGHQIWKTWWYPAGHSCRCYVFGINKSKAQRQGITGAEPTGPWPLAPEGGQALPDPGFRGSPQLDSITDQVLTPRLYDVARDARATQNTDLIEAMKALLQLLLGFDVFERI